MTTHELLRDRRIPLYIKAIQRLKCGEYDLAVPVGSDEIGRLGEALCDLARALESRNREAQKLDQITARINAGLLLDDILENVYYDFRKIIPYNRIGFSLIENDGQVVRARWAKSDQPEVKLTTGYVAPLEGSSLQTILTTGRPRILNDLAEYLERKPDSESTRLIVAEGIRSSLTCPLIADGVPVGFIFFSSIQPNAFCRSARGNFFPDRRPAFGDRGKGSPRLRVVGAESRHRTAERRVAPFERSQEHVSGHCGARLAQSHRSDSDLG